MPESRFPNPRVTTEEGIVTLGGNLDAETLRAAYRQGIFPWPIEGLPLPWFCPPERGILEFDHLHVPRSLGRMTRRAPFRLSIDENFRAVIRGCASAHVPTWITPAMTRAYESLHLSGDAHSVEAWEGEALVGGVYGVDCGGAFACESMFYLKPYASKLALLHLVEHLRGRGLDWIDIQMVTPHMLTLGARVLPRDAFLDRLKQTQDQNLVLFDRRQT